MKGSKTDPGRVLYEADLAKTQVYIATGKPRPTWDQLGEHVRNAWRYKAAQADA